MSPPSYEFSAPPHLSEGSWIEFEYASAVALVGAMAAELARLRAKIIPERVHKTRVSLRRWFSVWSILQEDDWEQEEFAEAVLKPLRKMLKRLGALRDFDVNIEIAEKFGCSKKVMKFLKERRKEAKRKLEKFVKKRDVHKLLEKIEPFLSERRKQLGEVTSIASQTPFERFDMHIMEHEKAVAELAGTAKSPEELHQLRLAIKKWRYLLTECLGVTNLDLVASQQLLGEIHDIDRLLELLEPKFRKEAAISKLKDVRLERLERFETYRNHLPYGLRPGVTSWKATAAKAT